MFAEMESHEPVISLEIFSEYLSTALLAASASAQVRPSEAPPLLPAAQGEAIGAEARKRGFDGRIVILGEPDVRRGDCRIEWADGGMVVDHQALADAVAALVDAHIATLDTDADAGEGATP